MTRHNGDTGTETHGTWDDVTRQRGKKALKYLSQKPGNSYGVLFDVERSPKSGERPKATT